MVEATWFIEGNDVMAGLYLGIDLGGTLIKFALLDDALIPKGHLELPTPVQKGPDEVIDMMIYGARKLLHQQGVSSSDLSGIGVASPGPIDFETGTVIAMPNIPGFNDIPLRARLADALGVETILENDANAAAMGEAFCGAGKNADILIMLTLGTGVGSGIIIDGKVLRGCHSAGAEIGHMIVEPNGEPCPCGQRGCLERYSSAAAVAQYARRLIENDGRQSTLSKILKKHGDIDASQVNDAQIAGDELAKEVWDRAMYFLAIGCINLARLFDPEVIILGGGMAKSGESLINPLRRYFNELHWTLTEPKTSLELSTLGSKAGVIGAAVIAWKTFGK